jgi:uncharacterized protein YbaP (TraB family)
MTIASGCLTLVLAGSLAAAEPPAEPQSAPAVLETVVVSGQQPGPGLWRISRDGHDLWILGTLVPVPRRMEWESGEVEDLIARAGAVIDAPSTELRIKGGALRGLFLLPAALGARNNPDDALLVDVVPADLYARWTALKRTYMGRNRSVERRRPSFAAWALFEKAVERSGMSFDSPVARVVKRAARRHDVAMVRPSVELMLEEPGDTVREFARTPLDDLACFRRTLDRLETDLEAMRTRANAWATGDLDALRSQPFADQARACVDAFLQNDVIQRRGGRDLEKRVADAWLTAAEAALAEHAVSFGTLPMGQVLGRDGYVERLRARGYAVEEPWLREERELGEQPDAPAGHEPR